MIRIIGPDLSPQEPPDRNPSNNAEERHLKKRNESSKQRGDDLHASNLILIILDEYKNPHNNLYYKLINGIAVPGGMLHQETHTIVFRLKF